MATRGGNLVVAFTCEDHLEQLQSPCKKRRLGTGQIKPPRSGEILTKLFLYLLVGRIVPGEPVGECFCKVQPQISTAM